MQIPNNAGHAQTKEMIPKKERCVEIGSKDERWVAYWVYWSLTYGSHMPVIALTPRQCAKQCNESMRWYAANAIHYGNVECNALGVIELKIYPLVARTEFKPERVACSSFSFSFSSREASVLRKKCLPVGCNTNVQVGQRHGNYCWGM